MFQSTASNILPIYKSELTEQSKSSNYNWKTLTKAGLVFITTTGAFLVLKTTGSFSLISSWLKNSSLETNLDESSALANFNTPSTQTYIAPASEEQPFIAHHYAKREPSAVIKIGPEFQVNTYTMSEQIRPFVAGLNDGKFVVTWESYLQDGSHYSVYGQMFNADGSKYSSKFQVNTYTANGQYYSSVAALSNSNFVVTWVSYGQDGDSGGIYGQIYNANSSKYGSEFRVNTYTTNMQRDPSVAGLIDGKFVVTWHSDGQDEDGYGIYSQMFNANGTKYLSEFQVNTYAANNQEHPSIAGLKDGKFVVTWHSNGQDGDSYGIYGQMYNTDGSKYSSEFQVNTYTTDSQWYSSVVGLNDGKFVVTWTSYGQDGNNDGVYGQIFNVDGSRFLSEFQVNTYTTNSQSRPCVAGLSDGKFVVTWDSDGQDGDSFGVYGQMFSLNETAVSSYFSSSQQIPVVNKFLNLLALLVVPQ